MFEEYKKRVVAAYKEKLSRGVLSNNISAPTPGKLKTECKNVYKTQQVSAGDRIILRDFFGPVPENGDFGSVIKNFDREKFKPLNHFLYDNEKDTDGKNVELLAWLIDFQPRPYRFDEFENVCAPQMLTPKQNKPFQSSSWWKNKNVKWSSLAFLTAAGTMALSSIFSNVSSDFTSKQCMYWNADHYEAIDCRKKILGQQIIALDTEKVAHFKLITKPDTLTTYSVNRVWYTKIDNVPQCFTAPGKHPIHKERQLKPLSLLILKKYFLAK